MTCYNCDKCGRYKHLSKLGEFEKTISIGKLKIKKTIWVCKWCMTRHGIKYEVINDFVEITSKPSKAKEGK